MSSPTSPSGGRAAGGTPRRILDAAFRCVAARGSAALSMSDVAEEAGVSKALIHYHFQDKDTLLARALADISAGLEQRERAALADCPPARMLDALWAWLERELTQGEIRVLLELSLCPAPIVREAARAALDMRRRTAAETIERLFAALGLRPRLPAALLAEATVAFADGLAIATAIDGPDRSPRVAFDAFWLAMLSLAE